MVEHVERTAAEEQVALHVHIAADGVRQGIPVPDIALPVDDQQEFVEHHLSGTPQGVGHLEGLPLVLLADPGDGEIVAHALLGKVQVLDFGRDGQLDGRQEDLLRGFLDILVLHRRDAHHRGGINGVETVRDAGNVEFRVQVFQRIEARMVAERPFEELLFALLHVAFDHEVAVGGHHQVLRKALYQLHGFSAEEAGQQVFVDAFRERRRGSIGIDGIATQAHGNGQAVRTFGQVFRAGLVHMPVHAGRGVVEDLHAVHPDIAHASHRARRIDERQGDEAPAVLRPALENGQLAQLRGILHDILAGRVTFVLTGDPRGRLVELRQEPELITETGPGTQHAAHQFVDLRPDVIEVGHAQRIADARLGAHQIGQHGESRAGILEQQRLAAAGFLRFDVGCAGDLQHRVDEFPDAPQLALFFQEPDIIFQTVVHIHSFIGTIMQVMKKTGKKLIFGKRFIPCVP